MLEQAGFPVSGLLATHADWDHLLGRLAFPAPRWAAGKPRWSASVRAGQAQRELREFDAEHYVDGRGPLVLGSLQSLPVPGHLEIGAGRRPTRSSCIPRAATPPTGPRFCLPWAQVLVCGDYLSPVEIPALSPGGSSPSTAPPWRA